jgi:hypothetical protein
MLVINTTPKVSMRLTTGSRGQGSISEADDGAEIDSTHLQQ